MKIAYYIQWEDVLSSASEWGTEEDKSKELEEPCIVDEVGFIFKEDNDYLYLTAQMLDDDTHGTVTKIPKSLIRHKQKLTIKKKK